MNDPNRIQNEKNGRALGGPAVGSTREQELARALDAVLNVLFDVGRQPELRAMLKNPKLTAPLRAGLEKMLLTDEEVRKMWVDTWEAGVNVLRGQR